MQHLISIVVQGKDKASATLGKLGAGLATLRERLSKLAQGLSGVNRFAQILNSGFQAAAKGGVAALQLGVSALSKVWEGLLSLFKLGIVLVGLVASAIAGLTAAMAAAITKATKYASELQALWYAFEGIEREGAPAMMRALQEASAGMLTQEQLLKEYNRAYTLVGATLTERMPEALRYLTKVALAQRRPLEEVLDSLVLGIGRLSTRFRVQIGVTVTTAEATARAAEMFGVAAEQLTYAQKQAGMLDLVLQKLAITTANMEDPVGTMLQQTIAMKVAFKDMWGDIGRIFLPVGAKLTAILHDWVKWFTSLFTEGGKLHPVLMRISATIKALLDLLGGTGVTLRDKLVDALITLEQKFEEYAWRAIEWGANISVNLAIGLIRGAATAITEAMGYLNRLLAQWLAPGSPPRFLPDLLQWGAATFTEYLRGFTMAEFDVLTGIQGPLRSALQVLADLGQIGQPEAIQSWISLTYEMTEALAQFVETGQMPEQVFQDLIASGGQFGEALAELFREELRLNTLTRTVAESERQLAEAQRLVDSSSRRLSQTTREYNRLVAQGAAPEVLQAKLAEAKAAYGTLRTARQTVEETEERLEAEREAQRLQREQVRVQQALLEQLIRLGQAQVELIEAQREASQLDYDLPEPPLPYTQGIDAAFQALVDSIKAKFLALWEDLKRQWEESGVVGLWNQAKEAWGEAWSGIVELWNTRVVPWWEGLKKAFRDWWAEEGPRWGEWVDTEGEKWASWWEGAQPRLSAVLSTLWDNLKRTADVLGIDLPSSKELASNALEELRKLLSSFSDFLRGAFDLGILGLEKFANWWSETLIPKLGGFKGWWDEKWPLIQAVGQTAWIVIKDAALAFWDVLRENVLPPLQGALAELGLAFAELGIDWGDLWRALGVAIGIVLKVASALILAFVALVAGAATGIARALGALAFEWRATVQILKGLLEGFLRWFTGLYELFAGVLTLDFPRALNGFVSIWKGIWQVAQYTFYAVYQTITAFLHILLSAICGFADGVVQYFRNLYNRLVGHSLVPELINEIVRLFLGLPGRIAGLGWELLNTGANLVSSLAQGIRDQAWQVFNALSDIVNNAINEIKRRLGIRSPSTVFAALGEMAASGFSLGMRGALPGVASAGGTLADRAIRGATTTAAAGVTQTASMVIQNYFGANSVRSDRDILEISERIARSMELRGVKAVLA